MCGEPDVPIIQIQQLSTTWQSCFIVYPAIYYTGVFYSKSQRTNNFICKYFSTSLS